MYLKRNTVKYAQFITVLETLPETFTFAWILWFIYALSTVYLTSFSISHTDASTRITHEVNLEVWGPFVMFLGKKKKLGQYSVCVSLVHIYGKENKDISYSSSKISTFLLNYRQVNLM